MPAPAVNTSTGNVVADNVIPTGQTIPFPTSPMSQQVKATGVALMVASTCGTSPEAAVAINYTPRYENAYVPPVPDWFASPGPAAITLGSYDQGTTLNTAGHPHLYEVMLPADPAKTLASITLPVTTANLLPNTVSCGNSGTLHILAIGVVPATNGTVPTTDGGGVWTGAYDGPMDNSASVACCLRPANETFREMIPLSSASGGYLRIRLSNAYSASPVTFDDVTVAAQASSGGEATVALPVKLTFSGPGAVTACGATGIPCNKVTLAAGADEYSDPVATSLLQLASGSGQLTVSMHIASSDTTVSGVSVHDQYQGMTTYYAQGDDTANSDGTSFSSANSMNGVDYLAGVDVSNASASTKTPAGTIQDTGTVAVLGDQGAVSAPGLVETPTGFPTCQPRSPRPPPVASPRR